MQERIQYILDQAYSIYRLENSSTVEFCDLMLSAVSFAALSTENESSLSYSVSTDIRLSLPMISEGFSREDLIKAFGAYKDRPESSWHKALLVEPDALERVSFTLWQYVLPAWANLFKYFVIGEKIWLLEKVFGKIELMLAEEQRDKQLYLTPKGIMELMAYYLSSEECSSLYDPFARSGDLLLGAGRKILSINRMMGVSPVKLAWKLSALRLLFSEMESKVELLDFEDREPVEEKFDLIISNPPFGYRKLGEGVSIGATKEWIDIAEKSNREEVVFLCHILSRLADNGRAVVLLPSTFLSRNMATGPVIKRMIEQNLIDAMVSLPSGLFEHTGIAVVLMAINKDRKDGERVLLADASSKFLRKERKNVLEPDAIMGWIDKLKGHGEGDGEEFVFVTNEEIAENDFGLNVAYYREHEEEIKERKPSKEVLDECGRIEYEVLKAGLELAEFLAKEKNGLV